jgi:Uma2 family endonuclease
MRTTWLPAGASPDGNGAPKNALVNPRLLVEITSDSTEEYDRGEKLASYQRIASLDAIVLASHREACLELFERDSDRNWRRSEARAGSCLRIASLGAELSVDEIYAVAAPA